MELPTYALLSDSESLAINYLCNIRDGKDYNIRYLEEKRLVIIRNCDSEGNLLNLTQSKGKYLGKSPWTLMKVKKFSEQVCLSYL